MHALSTLRFVLESAIPMLRDETNPAKHPAPAARLGSTTRRLHDLKQAQSMPIGRALRMMKPPGASLMKKGS
jgi:hypothetical protein